MFDWIATGSCLAFFIYVLVEFNDHITTLTTAIGGH